MTMPVKPVNDRIFYLDWVKVIACFLVIYAHLFSGNSLTCKYIYAFHVPLFFLVSGIFHHRENEHKIEWRQPFLSLIVPTILFIVIDGIAYSLQFGQERGIFQELLVFAKTIMLGLIRGSILNPYWFLIALFWCKIFTDAILSIKRYLPSLLIWATFLIIPLLLDNRLPLLLSQGLMGLPFYIAGVFAGTYLKTLQPDWRFILLVIPCLLLTVILSSLNGKVSMNGVFFGSLPMGLNMIAFYINAAIGCILVLAISLLPFPKWGFISSLSKSLITIVGLQIIFIRLFNQFIGADRPFFISIFAALIIMLLCHVLHFFMNPLYQKIRHVLPERRSANAS